MARPAQTLDGSLPRLVSKDWLKGKTYRTIDFPIPFSRSGPRPGRDPRISQVTNVHDRGGCYEQVGSTNGGIAFLFVLVSSCNVQLLETTFSN